MPVTDRSSIMSDLKFIFVHGAGGWGRYDAIDRLVPYWGMLNGSLISFLRRRGYDCYGASVAPSGSIWVRACELYAQISGTRTDYGAVHSIRENRERYGRDYSGDPLIPEWNENTRLVLLGHSMGGATVRLLAHLLEHGDEEERSSTPDHELSDLFRGNMKGRVHAVMTLAAPTNGASSLDMITDPAFDADAVPVPFWSRITMRILGLRLNTGRKQLKTTNTKRLSSIDRALKQNEYISTLPDVYYFCIACSSTVRQPDGTQYPDSKKTEILYYSRSIQIGRYTGVTPEGFVIDESWQENDGLVNTVSALAPVGAPQKPVDRKHIEKGIWNVMPVFDGDHMSVQGGLFHRRDVRWFYLDLLEMCRQLER